MEPIILDSLSFEVKTDLLMRKVRVKPESRHADDLRGLVHEAEAIARPKAVYRIAFTEFKDDDHVVLEGVSFKSRILRVNLENAYRVFPFVATCGMEIEDWARAKEDMLHRFWAERIKERALYSAMEALTRHIKDQFSLGKTSIMTPGSLEDWPLEEQKALFKIVGDTKKAIGVQLIESLMMIPVHSVSGILFPTEVTFVSCQLCSREDCPGRRAPYDEGLYEKKYQSR
ncbi:MAG: vitamin B12 dependent methionine synthase [Deltaproteobacteria bacterium]|nr:vitamin B12 dependent methionine synthase [Deltaproteobacteria bacterium]